MNGRVTLGLVIILAFLSGYVYFFELQTPDNTADNLTEIYGTTYGEYDIVELEIVETENIAHFVRTKATFTRDWKMLRPLSLAAEALDQVRVNGAATRLGRLTASQVITGVTDLTQYGLASPQLTVTLTISNGQKIRLYAGDKTPVEDNRYLRLAADNQAVYLVFGLAIDDLFTLINDPPLAPTPLPTITPRPTP